MQVLLLLSFANGMPSADDSALERGFSLSIAGVTLMPADASDMRPLLIQCIDMPHMRKRSILCLKTHPFKSQAAQLLRAAVMLLEPKALYPCCSAPDGWKPAAWSNC